MKKFNLKKFAASKDYTITDKSIEEQRNSMGMSNEAQDVVHKNINASLPTKDKDNTVPFNVQLNKTRKNETDFAITEAGMDDKTVAFGEKAKQVSDLNELSESLHIEKEKDFKKAQDASKKDTAFWDKYVGTQLEEKGKKVDKNVPDSASQLPNNPERHKSKEISKLVSAQLKDADAMLFHIFAIASSEERGLTDKEQQQITDINSGKLRLFAQMVQPVRRSLEYSPDSDPVIKRDADGVARVYEPDGKAIDEFKSCDEAKANYPEGKIRDGKLV